MAVKAVRLEVEKARDGGIAVVSVRNLSRVGMLAYYKLKIAEQKLIGLVTANTRTRVALSHIRDTRSQDPYLF